MYKGAAVKLCRQPLWALPQFQKGRLVGVAFVPGRGTFPRTCRTTDLDVQGRRCWLHISRHLACAKPSSKVEESTKTLEKAAAAGEKKPVEKRSLYKRIEDEVLHYYHGFRLLFMDIRISLQLINRILNGKTLSRREYKQLIRTTSDLFRLVPFSVFIIVPFMELLLPVFLKLFPGMLPSTFQTKKDSDAKMQTELKVKLDMAKFLQETLDSMAPTTKGRSSESAKEFAEFVTKMRGTSQLVTNEEIMRFSKLFEDEITLDSLSREQLLALCRLIEIPAYGTTALLRFQLRMRLRNLAADDRMIEQEGVDDMTYQELQHACKARGMRAVGVTEQRLKAQLHQWLQLSLHEKIPPSLLLLSRAMYLPDTLDPSAQLQATISALPNKATIQIKESIGEREGKIDNKTRIESIKEELSYIEEERKEKRLQKAMEEEGKKALEAKLETKEPEEKPVDHDTIIEDPIASTHLDDERVFNDFVSNVTNSAFATNTVESRLSRNTRYLLKDVIRAKDLELIRAAIAKLGKDKKEMMFEKEDLKHLKKEVQDYEEDVRNLEDFKRKTGAKGVKLSRGAEHLFNKLTNMISYLEKEVTAETIAVKTHEINAALQELIATEGADEDQYKIALIVAALDRLDDDRDGMVEIEDLKRVIQVMNRDNFTMTEQTADEIVSILSGAYVPRKVADKEN